MTTNNKSFVGVDNIYYALLTQDDADAYAAGSPAYLAPAMTITQTPKTNSKVQYADNQPFDSMSSEGETELDVEITGMMLNTLATLLGRVYDASNGQMFDNGGTPPDVALGFRAKRRDGLYRYYWFLKGNFQAPPEEQASETDTPDPKSTKLKFTAIRTIHQFALNGSITDSVKRVVGDTADENFSTASTWFDAVRVPVVGSPATLTLTPVPADDATGVAVSVSPTLTFSNAMDANVLNGITLVQVSDDSIVASAITINAARKVVTINPDSNLNSAEEYYISVVNARDVFGQTLANALVSFTTA